MKEWVRHHGKLLSRVSIVTVVIAIAVPLVGMFFSIPYLFGTAPYPAVNPSHALLAISALLTVVGLATGLAVWTLRAPDYHLGVAAVVVIGALIVVLGATFLGGFAMSLSHGYRS